MESYVITLILCCNTLFQLFSLIAIIFFTLQLLPKARESLNCTTETKVKYRDKNPGRITSNWLIGLSVMWSSSGLFARRLTKHNWKFHEPQEFYTRCILVSMRHTRQQKKHLTKLVFFVWPLFLRMFHVFTSNFVFIISLFRLSTFSSFSFIDFLRKVKIYNGVQVLMTDTLVIRGVGPENERKVVELLKMSGFILKISWVVSALLRYLGLRLRFLCFES